MAWGERRPNMGPPPVTEDWQLNAMCSWIDKMFTQPRVAPSAEPNTKSMEGEAHLWEYVYTVANDEPTVLVCLNGEKQRPGASLQDADRTHRVDRRWLVVLLQGHGFRNRLPQADGQPPGKESLTQSIAALRDTVRSMSNMSEEFPLHYDGWMPLRPVARPGMANVFLSGAELTFSTCNDLGEVGVW